MAGLLGSRCPPCEVSRGTHRPPTPWTTSMKRGHPPAATPRRPAPRRDPAGCGGPCTAQRRVDRPADQPHPDLRASRPLNPRRPSIERRCGSSKRSAWTSAATRRRLRYGARPERRSPASGCASRRELAMARLAMAPDRFTQHARNPERSVVIGGSNLVLRPGLRTALRARPARASGAGERSKIWRISSSSPGASGPQSLGRHHLRAADVPIPSATSRPFAPTCVTPTSRSWAR